MYRKQEYQKRKPKFLNNPDICKENRKIFKEFLEWEENKLKRKNNLRELDESCYMTLYSYLWRIENVNKWFKNKPFKDLTETDIKKVYNDLEDGNIKNQYGKPFQDRKTYYNKIMKSKLFELAGKKELARKIIEYTSPKIDEDVRFIDEQDFLKLERYAIQDTHKLLFWLAWDIGENINSILKLKKKHFTPQENDDKQGIEYIVYLPKEILKRSRTPRSEPTLYEQTIKLLRDNLQKLKEEDFIFDFDYHNAKKLFDRAVRLSKVKCKPRGQSPTWKDLRSGMACHLLRKGWTSDEVNARLGHKPSSRELDKYINYHALDRNKPKKKLFDNQLQKVLEELENNKTNQKLTDIRLESLKAELQELKNEIKRFRELK